VQNKAFEGASSQDVNECILPHAMKRSWTDAKHSIRVWHLSICSGLCKASSG